jgi:hypothetical protein
MDRITTGQREAEINIPVALPSTPSLLSKVAQAFKNLFGEPGRHTPSNETMKNEQLEQEFEVISREDVEKEELKNAFLQIQSDYPSEASAKIILKARDFNKKMFDEVLETFPTINWNKIEKQCVDITRPPLEKGRDYSNGAHVSSARRIARSRHSPGGNRTHD